MKNNHSATAWENVVEEVDLSTFEAMRKGYGSQAEIAKLLGLTDAAIISKFENGKSDIDKRTYTMFLLITNNHPRYEMRLKEEPEIDTETIVIAPPSGQGITIMRKFAGLTQGKMAYLLSLMNKENPNRPLISKYETDRQSPSPQTWTLFLLIIGQHPNYEIFPR